MRWIAVVGLLTSTSLAACTDGASSPRATQNTDRITGTVLEKQDGPPYSYLRLKRDAGEVWAAVPLTSALDVSRPVTITNGVALRGFEARPLGRKFEVIYFGTVERP